MPRFKVKDLMISLGTDRERRRFDCPWNSCGWTMILDPPCGASIVGCPAACSLRVSNCGPITDCGLTPCHPAITNTGPLNSLELEDVTTLKEELHRQMQQVEFREQELEREFEPRTLEEVAQLEEKLDAAASELQRRKAELERARDRQDDGD